MIRYFWAQVSPEGCFNIEQTLWLYFFHIIVKYQLLTSLTANLLCSTLESSPAPLFAAILAARQSDKNRR
jgi:hypothetical protein